MKAIDSEFLRLTAETMSGSRLAAEEMFIQHGNTSCLKHSLAVAYFCYLIAKKLGFIEFRMKELVRGALLHDYFLYDWHTTKPKNGLHGFSHPYTAFYNALFDFDLTEVEVDIITKHMFPLTPLLPLFKESVLVSLVDKVCSLYEVFSRNTYNIPEIQMASAAILHSRANIDTFEVGSDKLSEELV